MQPRTQNLDPVTLFLILFSALSAPSAVHSSAAAEPSLPAGSRRPNIVLFLADDMGWSDAGCYGGEIRTPHIDSLAADGLRFTQFYNNAVCGPTRASLLTGLYCQQTGHPGNHWNAPMDFSRCVLVSELLQAGGYRTMMVGKWQGRDLAVDRGFDRFFGPQCQGKISYYHEVQLNPFYLDRTRWTFPDEGFFMTDAFVDHAVEFLDEAAARHPGKPFFLYVAFIAPHWPLHAREFDIAPNRATYREHGWEHWRAARFARQQAMGLVPADLPLPPPPPGTPSWEDDPHKDWQAERMAVFAGQINCLDRGVGRVLDGLEKHGLAENTLVLFLSDNGAAPDGGHAPSRTLHGFSAQTPQKDWRLDGVPIRPGSGPENMPGPPDTFASAGPAWASVSNMPLHGAKSQAFEGGIRTPLVTRWPAVIRKTNSITHQPGHVIDLVATFLDVANLSYPEKFHGRRPLPIEGKSLVPVFRGGERAPHEILCWFPPRGRAIRMGPWKLVAVPENDPWELFHLEHDPAETRDLAAEHPDRVADMAARFEAWHRRVGRR